MKKLALLSLFTASLLLFQGCSSDDKKSTSSLSDKTFSLSTGSTNGVYYEEGKTIAKLMADNGYSFKVVSSDGGEQNGRRVFSNITNFGFIQKDTHNLLSTVDGNYSNKVNVISSLGEESILFIVNKNSDIKTEDDIKNNKVKIAITSKSSGANSSLDTFGKLNKSFSNKDIVFKDFDKALNELNLKTIDVLMIVQSNKNSSDNENIKKIIKQNNLDIIDIKDTLLTSNKLNGKKVYDNCKFNFNNKVVNTICTETLLISNTSTDSNVVSKMIELTQK